MKQFIIPVFGFVIFLLQLSCNDSGDIRKKVTGKPGEMVVVMSKEAWKDTSGSLIRYKLAQPHPALPQEEPLFDLINVPPEAFKEIFRTTRNILLTRISTMYDNNGIDFQNDVWAYPQTVIQIEAKSPKDFDSIVNVNSEKILSHYLLGEKRRLNANLDKYYDKVVYNTLLKDFKLTLKTAPGFFITKKTGNFAWIRYETPDISQGIVVHTYPYTSDSTFTYRYQIGRRDSMLRHDVPGPSKDSYMATEKQVDSEFYILEHNKNYACEMRGLWRVENDFMGGPYISLSELDASAQRIVEVYGYVYAPSKNKRDLLRQVEAMVYSLKFEDQEKNDKINSQIKMGN